MSLSAPVPLRIPGLDCRLKLRLHDERDRFVSRRIREVGIWEPFETSLVLASLSPGAVFVDVGANIGYFTVLAADQVGDMNGVQRQVEAVRAALSDEVGEGCLYLSEDNLGDHQIYAAGEIRERIPVPLVKGGEYLQNRIARLDLLKVDTQGSEFRVMSGLMPLLRQLPSPLRILIELTPLSLRDAGSSGRALIDLLATLSQPFWIVEHIEHRLVASSAEELARWCDDVDAVKGDSGFMNILVGAEVHLP